MMKTSFCAVTYFKTVCANKRSTSDYVVEHVARFDDDESGGTLEHTDYNFSPSPNPLYPSECTVCWYLL